MTTPTTREILSPAGATGTSMTLTTTSATAVGDLLVLFHFYDFNALTDLTTPTGTAGTWTLEASGDQGNNEMHIKVWTRPVTAAGAQTVNCNSSTSNGSHMPVLYTINGSSLTLSVDGAAGSQGLASTSHVCPSVSPVGSDDLLICGAGTSPSAAVNYTWSTMTKQTEVDVGSFSTASTATETLAASGATGTRTATSSTSQDFASATIAIRGVSSGTNAPAENAAATGAANTPAALVQFSASESTATGTAPDPLMVVGPAAAEASGSVTAPLDGTSSVSLTLISDAPVLVTVAANDPTVVTGSTATATPDTASVTVAVDSAGITLGLWPEAVTGTVLTQDGAFSLGVSASSADASATSDPVAVQVPVARWRLVMPKTVDYWHVVGSLRVGIEREATVFGDDTTLHTSFEGVLSGGGDADGAIPFNIKYLWFGGHDNLTADTAIRDLWIANGFTVQEV